MDLGDNNGEVWDLLRSTYIQQLRALPSRRPRLQLESQKLGRAVARFRRRGKSYQFRIQRDLRFDVKSEIPERIRRI